MTPVTQLENVVLRFQQVLYQNLTLLAATHTHTRMHVHAWIKRLRLQFKWFNHFYWSDLSMPIYYITFSTQGVALKPLCSSSLLTSIFPLWLSTCISIAGWQACCLWKQRTILIDLHSLLNSSTDNYRHFLGLILLQMCRTLGIFRYRRHNPSPLAI